MPRLIDADALEKEYRSQFESVYKNIRDTVLPSDFYIERKAAYDKELMRMEMEAFCEFLRSRPTIDAEPVRRGEWIKVREMCGEIYGTCSRCGTERARLTSSGKIFEAYCLDCGAKMTEAQYE